MISRTDAPRDRSRDVHQCRGLCRPCYTFESRHGDVTRYPRLRRSLVDVLDDVRTLRPLGLPRDALAERLGMSSAALGQALARARRRGVNV